jgi:DNA-binding SARP family transcriptional activator/DNA-binding HxlR family transcriptional regulator
VGERWSLLIMREAVFHDVTRFSDFERRVGVESDILAARLHNFVGAGLMTSRPVVWNSRPRDGAPHEDELEYLLTRNGRNLEPVIVALSTWADGWAASPVTELAITDPVVADAETGLSGADLAIAVLVPDAVAPPVDIGSMRATATGRDPELLRADAIKAISGPDRVLIEISLLGSFDLRVGGASVSSLAVGSQRLLAFLALHDRAVARIAMAGAMWPEVSDERAGISLRSALSRLDAATRDAILSAAPGLSLAEAVVVDLREGQALARRLLRSDEPLREADVSPAAVSLLSLELLPDWYDDWVLAEAEDWRQLRMSALEAQTVFLTDAGRLAEAAGAARAAMKVEPLRESAHASLIRVHLAEGNQSEALRVYDRFRALLASVLGLEPTPRITSLVEGLRKN